MQSEKEFIIIIKSHQGILYKVAKMYTEAPEDQKDLYQEIVYQLWKSFGSFKNESKIGTWIYRVALNTAISQLKKDQKHKSKITFNEEFIDRIDQVDHLVEERIQLLYKHIKALSLVEKGIMFLYLEGKSHSEIAQITGFSTSNVGTRIGRIKKKLQKQLKN